MLPEISVILARRASISSIDRSVAEQAGIFSKPWVLGAKAAQRVCEYFHALSRSRRRKKDLQFLCTVEQKEYKINDVCVLFE